MGLDGYIVNNETRELFTIRNFRHEAAFLEAVTKDRASLREVIAEYQSRSVPAYIDWLTDRLWAFTRTTQPGQIFVVHDNYEVHPDNAPVDFFCVHERGFRETGTIWDYQHILTGNPPADAL